MMRALQNAIWVSLCTMALAVPIARAQQSQQAQGQTAQQSTGQASAPIPAYRSPFAAAADNDDNAGEESQELAPDTRSLSGAQYLSLGMPTTRSYWQPRFDVSATADPNALETANSAGWGAWTSLAGGIDVHRTSESNDMTLSYTSGAMLSNNPGVSNGIVQVLSVADRFAFRHSALSFIDSLNYLPESSFGFGGLGGIALPGGVSSGLESAFATGQSILTGQGQNFGNSFVTELDTFLTPRTSFTLAGGYSVLHFFDSDLLDFNDFNFRGGYNYQITRKDAIALFYTFAGIRFSNFDQSIDLHTVQFSYARRVTGRLAFQVAAGPQVAISRMPISGNAASERSIGTGTNFELVRWSLDTALQWKTERTSLGLDYYHGATGGSGVLAGSLSDIVTGSVVRKVSRTFSNGITAGYSRNEGVAIADTTTSNQTYDYWFAGASLAHPMVQALGLTFSYQMQYQTSSSTFCIGPSCGTSVIRHMISVGVGWHERPLSF